MVGISLTRPDPVVWQVTLRLLCFSSDAVFVAREWSAAVHPTRVCVHTSLSPVSSTLALEPVKLSSLRLPPDTGTGYLHSLPLASQDRHVVLTPLLTHLTLLRRHRTHAIEDLILCAGAFLAGVAGAVKAWSAGCG